MSAALRHGNRGAAGAGGPWPGQAVCPTDPKGRGLPARQQQQQRMPVAILLTANPCVSVCKLDDDNVCIACGRSRGEIKGWKAMTPEARHDINMRVLATQGKPVRKRLLKALRKELQAPVSR